MIFEAGGADISAEDTVGGRISYAREIAELEMSEAAQRLGVLTSTWRAWECDRDTPRTNRLFMMAGILGVTPVWLLSGRGQGPAAATPSQLSESLAMQLETALADSVASQKRVQQIWERMRVHSQAERPDRQVAL